MSLPDGPEFEAAHLEGRNQSSLSWEACKPWPGCTEEILVGNGLGQMSSEDHSSLEIHFMVLGREGK